MATPTYATVISQINTYIVANANNEITANVLNPVLKVITDFANNTIGNLTNLTTTDTDTIVGAINSLKIAFENLQNNGIQLSTGYTNPNVTPPTSYNYGDFYMELDISDDSPIQLWQWNGNEWTTYSSVYTKAEIDYLLSNYYTKSELLTQIGISTGGQNELIEKGFNHVINFDWFVFAQVYRFNGIVTENLVTDTITLDPSPTTTNFKRFDVIVFNDNFTFSVVKGDEGLNPAIPKIDIKTQIQLTVILVEANTTEPSYLTKQLMYDEGVGLPAEFAVTKTGTSITIDSTEQSSSGTKSIKVANPINSDVLFLDKNVVFRSLDVDTITFKVKNVNAGNWRFYLYSYNSIDSFYQGTVIIKNGTYGYKSNNITDWQTIIVPMSHMFGSSEVLNTGFAITFFNDSLGTFFFDEFALNGNFTESPISSDCCDLKEDLSNKKTDIEANKTSNIFYAPIKSIYDWVILQLSTKLNDTDVLTTVSPTNKIVTESDISSFGGGDMLKSTYDPTTVNGDAFDMDNMANMSSAKTTPIDADNLTLWDSVGSLFKKVTWANIKATLKTYFDTLYIDGAGVLTTILTGISFVTGTAIVATDTVLEAFGKLQKQITDIVQLTANSVGTAELKPALKTRITNSTVTGTYTLNHALGNDWKLTLTGITTIDESNLPTGTDTIEFTMKVTGNFGLTVPVYWTVLGDTYDGAVWNFFAVQIHKGDATQEATCFISNF